MKINRVLPFFLSENTYKYFQLFLVKLFLTITKLILALNSEVNLFYVFLNRSILYG